MKHTYHIHGMSCNGCRNHVEGTLSKVDGVTEVEVNLEKAEAVIEMEEHIPIKKFEEALEKDGGGYSIHAEGHHHKPKKKEKNRFPTVMVPSIAPCNARETKPMMNLVIVLFVGWIWWRNKTLRPAPNINGPVPCIPKWWKMAQVLAQNVEWSWCPRSPRPAQRKKPIKNCSRNFG